jgi:hypothetical protein
MIHSVDGIIIILNTFNYYDSVASKRSLHSNKYPNIIALATISDYVAHYFGGTLSSPRSIVMTDSGRKAPSPHYVHRSTQSNKQVTIINRLT